MKDKKKIIWPISPGESEEKADVLLKGFLEVLTRTLDVQIQPVYVLSADYFITSEYFEPIDIGELKKNMEQECHNYLEKSFAGIEHENPIILENSFSARGAEASLFCEYVKEVKPDFVVMNTHGRSGWSRTFLGSFAESFLLKSTTPTFLIGPECLPVDRLKNAMMPMQLSESSKIFLEGFLDDHRLAFLEQLTLFHKISMVDIEEIAWAPSLYGLGDYTGLDLLVKARETTENLMKAYMDHPLSEKRLHYKISEKLEAVSEVIAEESKGYDLVVMRTECGALEANLLGSVTRDVIRHSQRPVVVYPHLFEG